MSLASSTVVGDINISDKVLDYGILHISVPILGLLAEPGETLLVGHDEVGEEEQGGDVGLTPWGSPAHPSEIRKPV